MADELNLEELEQEAQRDGQERNNIKDRFTKLSQKIDEEAKARAKAEEIAAQKAKEAESIARERDFYKNFNPLVSKYNGAADYQDKIREKVLQGYEVEDATLAVLAKEGKFTPQPKPVEQPQVAGGSAATIAPTGSKSVSEMTAAEKRQKLVEMGF